MSAKQQSCDRMGSALLLCLLLFRSRLHWCTGPCLLLLYAGYLAYQYIEK